MTVSELIDMLYRCNPNYRVILEDEWDIAKVTEVKCVSHEEDCYVTLYPN